MTGEVGLRWTLGDVAAPGYEALRLALWGAHRVFGDSAAYTVCVNTVSLTEARQRTGAVPSCVQWHASTGRFPDFLARALDAGMAEGKAWKLDPLRLYPDRFEIALDNDCVLWDLPEAVARWLQDAEADRCLIASDVSASNGVFANLTRGEARNAGIRGTPPGFDLEEVLRALLEASPVELHSELDEQGLQVAAVSHLLPPRVVSLVDVTICSPFPPHLPHLGRCGAHFVGLNDHQLPWSFYDRPASEWVREHWAHHRGRIYELVGLPSANVELI